MTRRGCHRWNAKTDKNQKEIFEAIQKAGYLLLDTSKLGGGVPDCFVFNQANKYIPIEIKTKTGKLSEKQVKWHEDWKLSGGVEVVVVTNLEEALGVCRELL